MAGSINLVSKKLIIGGTVLQYNCIIGTCRQSLFVCNGSCAGHLHERQSSDIDNIATDHSPLVKTNLWGLYVQCNVCTTIYVTGSSHRFHGLATYAFGIGTRYHSRFMENLGFRVFSRDFARNNFLRRITVHNFEIAPMQRKPSKTPSTTFDHGDLLPYGRLIVLLAQTCTPSSLHCLVVMWVRRKNKEPFSMLRTRRSFCCFRHTHQSTCFYSQLTISRWR